MPVPLTQCDLVETSNKVQRGKDCAAMEAVESFLGIRHWIVELDCLLVEHAVIDAHAEAAIGFRGKQDRRRPARTGWTYPALGKEGVNLLCQLGALERSQTIGFEHPGCGTQHEINGGLIAARGGSVRRVTGHNLGKAG